jgi:hypothetical protein
MIVQGYAAHTWTSNPDPTIIHGGVAFILPNIKTMSLLVLNSLFTSSEEDFHHRDGLLQQHQIVFPTELTQRLCKLVEHQHKLPHILRKRA